MPIEKIRNLAKFGVISDVDPFDLDPRAFSVGVNVRFSNGKVTGGPVFRNVAVLGNTSPRFVFASNPTSGQDQLFIGYTNGGMTTNYGPALADCTAPGYAPSTVEATWSFTTLAGITYVNRSDRTPWYKRTSDTNFQLLGVTGGAPASWDNSWSCQLLRTCAGALVALNVTKGATSFPAMVKTSSIPTVGTIPASWDQTQANTLAVENTLSKLSGSIVDACGLGNDLIIYGNQQAFHMYANGQTSVYTFDPLPFNKGAINANCSIELDGKNIVFGPTDIWEHDGNSEKSICDQRVRNFIFDSLNLAQASRCFVVHNPKLFEISFAYVSGDGYIAFSGGNGCNRQATWNYATDTWTFDDLPNVFSGCVANISNPLTYASAAAGSTYDAFGGSYQDQEDGLKRGPVYVGEAASAYGLNASLYAFDLYGQGSSVAFPVDTNATRPRYLERTGIDLDELNAEIRGYKMLASIYPQARLGTGASNLLIDAGCSDNYNTAPTWSGYQPFNGVDLYKCDFNAAGRWLAYRVSFPDYKEMALIGIDLDIKFTSRGPQGK